MLFVGLHWGLYLWDYLRFYSLIIGPLDAWPVSIQARFEVAHENMLQLSSNFILLSGGGDSCICPTLFSLMLQGPLSKFQLKEQWSWVCLEFHFLEPFQIRLSPDNYEAQRAYSHSAYNLLLLIRSHWFHIFVHIWNFYINFCYYSHFAVIFPIITLLGQQAVKKGENTWS